MDYIRGIDVQARIRFYDAKDHYDMCKEALEWNKKHHGFELHQIYWRLARSCFKYFGLLGLQLETNKKADEWVKGKVTTLMESLLKEMKHYSEETLKLSDCHPMGKKYKAIACWLMAKKADNDEVEMRLLFKCKKLLDEAIETLPNDHELRQYRGLWHYKAARVSTVNRFAARMILGIVVPKGTIDEAIADLKIAADEFMKQNGRKNFRTTLLLGLCYQSKGEAAEYKSGSWSDLIKLPRAEDMVDGDLMEEEVNLFKENELKRQLLINF